MAELDRDIVFENAESAGKHAPGRKSVSFGYEFFLIQVSFCFRSPGCLGEIHYGDERHTSTKELRASVS
jgi:hypothetical protein